jgi:thiol-disulfide isomerase/thioredoxin
VTLYRWWTDGCPFCKASLPGIESLRKQYGDKGLKVVAVYHPKPAREVKDQAVLKAADRIGYRGAIAVDEDWSVLKRLYLDTGQREATSASFLVDAKGVIRFVHPGPDFFPSSDPAKSRQNEDHRLVEQAVKALVEAKPE